MLKPLAVSLLIMFGVTTVVAQNSNSSTRTAPRTPNTNQKATTTRKAAETGKSAATAPAKQAPATKPAPSTPAAAPGSAEVVASFNKLLDGIRHADVNEVAAVYWNSPRLALFNNNGTVTKGWEQMRKNRESSYPDVKDVKLDVKDVSVIMLGRDGALVTALWTQSQTYKGTPESASGRMTLVFRRSGREWKAVHLHTSPDKEDPSRVLPSEQITPGATPSPTPAPTPSPTTPAPTPSPTTPAPTPSPTPSPTSAPGS